VRGCRAAALILGLVLLAGSASAAPFLQFGIDAARTGASLDPGPRTLDLAFNTTAAATPGVDSPGGSLPVVLAGAVFLLHNQVIPDTIDGHDLSQPGQPGPAYVEQVDLSTGRSETIVHLGDNVVASGFLSDGERLFVAFHNEVQAYDPATGAPQWGQPYRFPQLVPAGEPRIRCNPGASDAGVLYLPCYQGGDGDPTGLFDYTLARPVVVALAAETGEELWAWRPESEELDVEPGKGVSLRSRNYAPTMVAVGGGYVFVNLRGFPAQMTTLTTAGGVGHATGSLYALDAHTGVPLWSRPWDSLVTEDPDGRALAYQSPSASILYAPGVLYVKHVYLRALDPASGREMWSLRLQPEGDAAASEGLQNAHAIALFGDRIYATSFSTLYAIDTRTRTIAWETDLPAGENWEYVQTLIVAGNAVYGAMSLGRLFSVSTADGTVTGQRDLGPIHSRFAVGESTLVASAEDGRLFVLGRTPASIQPRVALSALYPAPGEAVHLDFSGTRPGVLHPTVLFQVDWGDGTLSPESPATASTHAYATAGERTITVRMRNAAGQEASERLTVYVGGAPPPELNFMQRAFAPERLDTTWGLIGLAVVLFGTLVAALERRRHHSVLERELVLLERIRERGASAAEAAARELEAYTGRIRKRLAARRLNDAQFAVLRLEIGEVGRSLRRRAVAPLSAVVSPRFLAAFEAALEDGWITAVEAEALHKALRRERGLGPDARRRVAHAIEAWREPH
jgi:outer membrane protein assembly factor BamB